MRPKQVLLAGLLAALAACATSAADKLSSDACFLNGDLFVDGQLVPTLAVGGCNRSCICRNGLLLCEDCPLSSEPLVNAAELDVDDHGSRQISSDRSVSQIPGPEPSERHEAAQSFEGTAATTRPAPACEEPRSRAFGEWLASVAQRVPESSAAVAWWALLAYALAVSMAFFVSVVALAKRSSHAKLPISFPPAYDDQPKLVTIS